MIYLIIGRVDRYYLESLAYAELVILFALSLKPFYPSILLPDALSDCLTGVVFPFPMALVVYPLTYVLSAV